MKEKQPTHIKALVQDPRNYRKHNPKNVGLIVDSLQRVGAARSIVIDENNVVLAGNATIEAAGEAGITRMRVVEADGNEIIAVRRRGLSAKQKKQLAIADNRTAELAEWDFDILAADYELTELGDLGFEKLLAELTANVEPFGDTDTDRDGQGVASTWEMCRKTGCAPVRIGPWESRIPIALAETIVADCTRHFEKTGEPMHERLTKVLICGLRS